MNQQEMPVFYNVVWDNGPYIVELNEEGRILVYEWRGCIVRDRDTVRSVIVQFLQDRRDQEIQEKERKDTY